MNNTLISPSPPALWLFIITPMTSCPQTVQPCFQPPGYRSYRRYFGMPLVCLFITPATK